MKHLDPPIYHQRIQDIRNNLSSTNISRFSESCFGSFLDLQEVETHIGLLCLIINSLVDGCDGERRLSFVIKETQIELGAAEFYYLTGLTFNKGSIPPKFSSFHDDIFKGKPDLTFADIKRAFDEHSRQEDGNGTNVFKLSLLYILYGVVLYQGTNRMQVDLKHVHMVDNIDKFNSYHWGIIAYDNFVSYAQSLAKRVRRSTDPKNVLKSTREHGLCFLLQIWAFEVMPDLSLCPWAIQRRLLSRISPRMLRWAVMPYSTSNEFKIEFSARDCMRLTPMKASEEEKENWEKRGIKLTSEECSYFYSRQKLPNSISESIDHTENLRDSDVPLPAWDQIVTQSPGPQLIADGTRHLIKEIYGKIDEAIIRNWRKDYGLADLSHKLDGLLCHGASVTADIQPNTPGFNRPEKRCRR